MGDTAAEAEGPLRLGLDVGGTKAVFVVVRPDGEIEAESRLERWTTGDPERDVRALLGAAHALVEGAEARVEGGGVSSPGPIDVPNGYVLQSPNLPGWVRVPLVARLRTEFGGEFLLENDANCAAFAEWRFGAGRGSRNLLFLTMSTGVGAGLVLEGSLYRGSGYQAGEVGHMPIALGGRRCHCGLRGCLEAYVGGAALADRIREDLGGGARSAVLELAQGDLQRISAELWTRAIREGDAYAMALREEFLDRLGQGLAALIHALDPDRVVLGTIIAANPDLFLEPLRERVRGATWPEFHSAELVPAQLGPRLPYLAATCAALLGLVPSARV